MHRTKELLRASNSKIGTPNPGAVLIAIIAAVAIVLAVASSAYYVLSAESIIRADVENTQRAARIQTHDISDVLANKARDIRDNLIILANTNIVLRKDVQAAPRLFSAAYNTTSFFTDTYFWVDEQGKLVWAHAFTDPAIYRQYVGADRSDRPYYMVPKQTHGFYITSIVQSVDGVPRLYFSYPIVDRSGGSNGSPQFKGVIVASANLPTVGRFLKSQISSEAQNSIGLMATDGTILYSEDESNIGLDFFGDKFQSKIPGDLKPAFNATIEKLLRSTQLGQAELSYRGNSGTIVYQPVAVDGNALGVLYVVAPHATAAHTGAVLQSQQSFTLVLIATLAGVAVSAAVAITKWNRLLASTVRKRTEELEATNRRLEHNSEQLRSALSAVEESNRKLQDANEQLKAHDRLQAEFINIAAHELRTPVQPILAIAAQLQEDLNAGGKEETRLTKLEVEILARNARRLSNLASEILDVSRIESKTLKLHREKVDLGEKVRQVVEDMGSYVEAGGKKIDLLFTPPAEPVFVNADRSRVFEVLSNLLINAVKFTENGSIRVTLAKDEKNAVVSIRDSGRGIDQDMVPKLFTKFSSKSEQGPALASL